MSQEAVLLYELQPQIPYTCADATAIAKGTVLKVADPMTVSKTAGAADVAGGIAGSEKLANDGITQMGVYTYGIFKILISGNVTVGDALVTDAAANFLKLAPVNTSGSQVFGHALETGTTGESIKVMIDVYGSGAAFV